MLMRRIRTIHDDERGVALMIVMLVGVTLVVVSAMMITRGFSQLVSTVNDGNWDNALFAAEAGLDQGLVILDRDFDYTTGEIIPDGVLGTDDEKAWAVDAADAQSESLLYELAAGLGAGERERGEYALVRPTNADVLFAVGFAPSRSDPQRRVRVVRATVEGNPWTYTLEYALMVGDVLELSGSGTINDVNDNDGASVHANGQVADSGGYIVEGCLTSSETSFGATAACPPSPLPLEPLPVVDPLIVYPYAHYALCDDGVAYGGPLHPTDPDPDGVPCSGDEAVVTANGWESATPGGVRTWTPKPWADFDGVFYIDNGNFDGKLGSDTLHVTTSIVTASGGGDTCAIPATGQVQIDGNSAFEVHPSLAAAGFDIAVVAQGDVDFEGQAAVGGAILAHEQIDYRGTADSWGAVVAVDACHTVGSPVVSSILSGGAVINYPGPITTPFTASTLRADVVGWYEL